MSDNLARALADAHRGLYLDSPIFKSAIDTLAGMLPLMVDGLAAYATKHDAEVRSRLEFLGRGLGPGPSYITHSTPTEGSE